ncbi:hypothetical protein O181_091245 [Austropuccinia psidii MF-1]|uniref:Uncharacterized protein n=1 Tax=Austropuccinia psidii MF-1 TaxID=1389203 RepID=A0A9Q3IXD2_9BASI|nr:hypothetical protein [Austropuccinia psidii MF-1]
MRHSKLEFPSLLAQSLQISNLTPAISLACPQRPALATVPPCFDLPCLGVASLPWRSLGLNLYENPNRFPNIKTFYTLAKLLEKFKMLTPTVLANDPSDSPSLTSVPPPSAVDEISFEFQTPPPIDTTDIGVHEAQKTQKLEQLLAQRPEKAHLVEKNVLKAGNLDPSLQAKQLELAKNQLEDKLNAAISHRPQPAELVKEGILKDEETPVLQSN